MTSGTPALTGAIPSPTAGSALGTDGDARIKRALSSPKLVSIVHKHWNDSRRRKRGCLSRILLGLCTGQFGAFLSYERSVSLTDADAVLRRTGLEMTLLSIFGIILTVLHNGVCFNSETLVFLDASGSCPIGDFLKWTNIICSLIFVHRLAMYYHCRSYIEMREWHLSTRVKAFVESGLIYQFAIELVIALWQPIPGMEMIYGMGHKVVIVMMTLRFYLIVRVLRDMSPAYVDRRRIRFEFEGENPGIRGDIHLDTVLKTQFYSHTQLTIMGTFFYIVFSLAYVIYILEREQWVLYSQFGSRIIRGTDWVLLSKDQQQTYTQTVLADYFNCIWLISVTATTVGYGDLTPHLVESRIICILAAILGIVTTSLLVSVLTNRLAPTSFQQFVIDYLNRSSIREKKRVVAATMIQLWWKETVIAAKPKKQPPAEKTIPSRRRSSITINAKSADINPLRISRVTMSRKGRFHAACLEFTSLRSREAQMKTTSSHEVTEFQGLTRAILAEQMNMRKTMNEMQNILMILSSQIAQPITVARPKSAELRPKATNIRVMNIEDMDDSADPVSIPVIKDYPGNKPNI